MKVEFYNKSTDITIEETDNLITAQHIAGDLLDAGLDDVIQIYVYNEDDDTEVEEVWGLIDFVASKDVFREREEAVPIMAKDMFSHADHNERLIVLKYTPHAELLDEISRRFSEYDKFTATVFDALDNLKIYESVNK